MQGPVRSRNFALIEKQIGFFREPEIEISTNFQNWPLLTTPIYYNKHVYFFLSWFKITEKGLIREKEKREEGFSEFEGR